VECALNQDCAVTHPTAPICDVQKHRCVSCKDGVKNGNETDVDCGGPECGACLGQPCDPANGCGDGTFCAMPEGMCCSAPCDQKCEACVEAKTGQPDGTCAPITLLTDPDSECTALGGCGASPGKCRCEDGLENGAETDVDCGGAGCPACEGGRKCLADADCAADVSVCVDGACCESTCKLACLACNAVGLCTNVPTGASDPAMFCTPSQVCGAGTTGCVGKAGAACNPSLNGADCLSGVCPVGPKVCAKSATGKPCNTTADCATGACQNYVCL
jgi:hypothetical protein